MTTQTTEKVKASAKAATGAAESFTSAAADRTAEAFAFGMKGTEIPVAFRELADRSIDQAKDFYARAKTAAEEANEMMEDTFETARQNTKAMSLKTLDAMKSGADASFALFKDLLGAKTFADAMELQTAFARKQWETATEQMKEFQEVAQKTMMDSAKPGREAWEKAFKTVAA